MAKKSIAQASPRLWLVRGGVKGADEAYNLREDVTSIHWNDSPDPRTHTKQELQAYFKAHRDHGGPYAAGQIVLFCHEMRSGDYVVMPRRIRSGKRKLAAVGIVTGGYEYLPYNPHPAPRQTRAVEWIMPDLDRESLEQASQERLKQRPTCQLIHDERVVRDILTHAGVEIGKARQPAQV